MFPNRKICLSWLSFGGIRVDICHVPSIWNQLEDGFTDDAALLAHSHTQMQKNLQALGKNSAKLELHVNRQKKKKIEATTYAINHGN